MDAIVGVWFSSVIGAAAFSVAGYVLGQSQKPTVIAPVILPSPPERKKKKKRAGETPSTPDVLVAAVHEPDSEAVIEAPSKRQGALALHEQHNAITSPPSRRAEQITAPPSRRTEQITSPPDDDPRPSTKNTAFPPAPRPPSFADDDDEVPDRPTLVPDMASQEAMLQSSVKTIPPPRAPSMSDASFDRDATRAMIRDALAQVEQAAEQTRALEIANADLHRYLDIAKKDLKDELVLRVAAETRAEELSDRLARASEEAGSLRHRVNMLDRQAKLLRESLKDREASDGRRRDLEEAEDMRMKLRDVVTKLERASMPPPSSGGPTTISTPPEATPRAFPGSFPGTAGLPRSMRPAADDSVILREEIARLAQENRALRAQTLGSLPPKPTRSRDSVPEIDFEKYRAVMERLDSVAGLRGAVLADEVGSLMLGGGDLAESLAAFGAYIRDAAARTDRLLPLSGVEEVDIRDRSGMMLSTRVVLHEPMALSLVFLASADASFVAARKIIEEGLRL